MSVHCVDLSHFDTMWTFKTTFSLSIVFYSCLVYQVQRLDKTKHDVTVGTDGSITWVTFSEVYLVHVNTFYQSTQMQLVTENRRDQKKSSKRKITSPIHLDKIREICIKYYRVGCRFTNASIYHNTHFKLDKHTLLSFLCSHFFYRNHSAIKLFCQFPILLEAYHHYTAVFRDYDTTPIQTTSHNEITSQS